MKVCSWIFTFSVLLVTVISADDTTKHWRIAVDKSRGHVESRALNKVAQHANVKQAKSQALYYPRGIRRTGKYKQDNIQQTTTKNIVKTNWRLPVQPSTLTPTRKNSPRLPHTKQRISSTPQNLDDEYDYSFTMPSSKFDKSMFNFSKNKQDKLDNIGSEIFLETLGKDIMTKPNTNDTEYVKRIQKMIQDITELQKQRKILEGYIQDVKNNRKKINPTNPSVSNMTNFLPTINPLMREIIDDVIYKQPRVTN
ncbi:uncharacterized protein LOC142979402 [Anticarsia gemmatalis]|uniref:uncharacterized protein LOC142979402 n=1 Tax=Anticarsia gemmatalis TaxID=129554 RepID=UPI003F75E590